jgi:hypothetical protein
LASQPQEINTIIMNRFTRKLVSLLAIFAVLTAQLAVSAYACPMQFMGMDEAVAETGALAADATDAVSTVPDAASPALCQKHCEQGQQNVNDTPQALAHVSVAAVFIVSPLIDTITPATASAPFLQHATSPPFSIRNCCFRI